MLYFVCLNVLAELNIFHPQTHSEKLLSNKRFYFNLKMIVKWVFTAWLICFISICSALFEQDIVCMLPKKEGICAGNHLRFYYDQKSERCKPFKYTGCGGNRNRFKNIRSCMKMCSVDKEIEAEQFEKLLPPRCLLSRKVGPCNGHYLSYFFNYYTHKCEPFRYSGCGGNGNRFASPAECYRACRPLHYGPPMFLKHHPLGNGQYHNIPGQISMQLQQRPSFHEPLIDRHPLQRIMPVHPIERHLQHMNENNTPAVNNTITQGKTNAYNKQSLKLIKIHHSCFNSHLNTKYNPS
ncbi:hypothetical protein GJ496_001636 [Pomphorhynchus laevis]|nr:hypothetical protein GJ496_001636 [Pomphorhynchus laevis]